jgi:hypothetical protein
VFLTPLPELNPIINLSFVGNSYDVRLESAIRRAYNAGVLVVAAAGNDNEAEQGRDLSKYPMYPVCNDGYTGADIDEVYFYNNSASQRERIFAFASELQSLRQHPEMSKTINPQSLHDFLSLQYIPSPDTIYKNVKKLPPAHILELDENTQNVRISQ